MKNYVDAICQRTVRDGAIIDIGGIPISGGYHDGVVMTPLDFETDEFAGVWFVEFGMAVEGRFAVYRLDLGQARFRFMGDDDLPHPEAITKNQAEVKRDELIEEFDRRFGPHNVNTAATAPTDAARIWRTLWPCRPR